MLDALGVEIGDEVEITVAERKLLIRAVAEAERQAKLDKIFAELMIERDSAYRKLAEGVP
jgi:antitoxin component of MazEF toxin-antitoxin module